MSTIEERANSPFHAGEQQVQERLGVREIENWARKAVRPYLPDQHRAFYAALPFLVAAARDAAARPWVTLLSGEDGFIASPDPASLTIEARPVAGDALSHAFVPGADIGILGIELATRRRNRVNGRVVGTDGEESDARVIALKVDQSFGNCPQYIREREWHRVDGEPAGVVQRSRRLGAAHRDWIADADTFFIASGLRPEEGNDESRGPAFGMDASHRGGERGFVSVASDRRLVFPDYAGNNHFNTIGNLVLDPRVGLLFVDFATGSLLQITGRATIDWESDAVAAVPGARRLVVVDIEEVVELPAVLPLRWSEDTGSVRSLRLVEKIRESADVVSFVFEARDGGALADFTAGQHLPIELVIPGHAQPLRRTYSLSGPGDGARYRISVKREPEGAVSRYLHDELEPGAIISARAPAGDFVLPHDGLPVVLVSAGVGLTPMVSMLHALVNEAGTRPVWFVHGARDGDHFPLVRELRAIASRRPGVVLHAAFSQPQSGDVLGVDYDSAGRVDGGVLAGLTGDRDAHYMLCGPAPFMAGVQGALEARGVPPERIHSETFGPAGSLARSDRS